MARIPGALLLVALAGCAQLPPPVRQNTVSACALHESSYACQVERYNAIGTQ